MPDATSRVAELVGAHSALLIELSRELHTHPELGFEERQAHELLSGTLEDHGLRVERSAFGLETAFAGRAGSSGPQIAVICEYDALPELGHACGHNVIAATGVGAGIALAALAEEAGGRVLVLGTPAEEGGGGKVLMAGKGAFDGVAAALIVHPADKDAPGFNAIALQRLQVRFTGSPAHAVAAPHQGRNALDAAVAAYQAVAALRQQLPVGDHANGIITDGGAQPNVIPEHAALEWFVRSPTVASLTELKLRVGACMEAGAHAAGCQVELDWLEPMFADLVHNRALGEAFAAHAALIGRRLANTPWTSQITASTDMGNVSQLVPAIHPLLAIAPAGTQPHTLAFAEAARSPAADRAILDGAIAIAATAMQLWCDPERLGRAWDEHESRVGGDRRPPEVRSRMQSPGELTPPANGHLES